MRLRRHIGSFAIEVLVAALVAAAIAVPLLTLLFQERDTEQRSRFEYLAVLAARDEMYESRFAVLAGGQLSSLAHPWTQVKGGPLDNLRGAAPNLTVGAKYYADQAHVSTTLALEPGGSGRLRLATVQARWVDPDSGAQAAGKKERPSSFQLVFGILLPPWVPPPP